MLFRSGLGVLALPEHVGPQPQVRDVTPGLRAGGANGVLEIAVVVQKILLVDRVAGGARQFGRRPKALVRAVIVAVTARRDSLGIVESYARVLVEPRPRLARRTQALRGVIRLEGLVGSRGHRHHGGPDRK